MVVVRTEHVMLFGLLKRDRQETTVACIVWGRHLVAPICLVSWPTAAHLACRYSVQMYAMPADMREAGQRRPRPLQASRQALQMAAGWTGGASQQKDHASWPDLLGAHQSEGI